MFQSVFSTEIWLNTTTIVGLLYAIYLTSLSNKKLLRGSNNNLLPTILVIIATLYIGTRPIWCYADTWLYTTIFNLVQSGAWVETKSIEDELFWNFIEYFCISVTDASGWLLVISCFYVLGMSIAAYRWFPKHFLLAVIFMFTAFSFWGYATNGLRQGMSTSLALVGLSFFMKNKLNLIIGYSFLILAALTHTSCLLLIAVATTALFFKNTKTNIKIWLCSIVVGLLFQSQFKSLFAGIIDDERMTNYLLNIAVTDNLFTNTGFRWDFIIYSSMPIILGWYAIIKKGQTDKTYTFLLNTYIFANAFWILINTAAYSNRFAYLSWFMYPIILVYPLVKFQLLKRQGIVTGLILLAAISFTFVM